MRRRKEEISAVMVYEAGKPWDEAVGDAAEGIDFIEYIAATLIKNSARSLCDHRFQDL
jgi:1-pyrroline-5-carboxylate dehydrogenase